MKKNEKNTIWINIVQNISLSFKVLLISYITFTRLVMKKKYDVFISSKSEDYSYAEEVYDFLRTNNLSVFLACKELDRLGDSEYAKCIDEALDNTLHMVVIASSMEYLKYGWVYYEWSTFCNDLNSGYRTGNIITLLTPNIKLPDLPASLRHKQSFVINDYKSHILSYIGNNDVLLSVKLFDALKEKDRLKTIILEKDKKINELQLLLQFEKQKPTQLNTNPVYHSGSLSFESTSEIKKTGGYHKVVLMSVGNNKNRVKRCIQEETMISADEADYYVSKAPIDLFGSYSYAQANQIRDRLISCGATATICKTE